MRYLFGWMCVFALGVVGCGGAVGTFPCTEQGVLDAIAEGDGPHFFACDGPTTVVTESRIVIDNDVILDGRGDLTVDGNDDHRVFEVPEGVEAELRGLTATRGNQSCNAISCVALGGGIGNGGTLTLTNSTVSGNTADLGGGISNSGTLTLTNSTVSGNDGGGITSFGTLTLTNSTVSGNTGTAILNDETGTLTNSTVSGNTGAAITNPGTLTLTNSTVSGNGSGIENSETLTLTNSTVSGNTAVVNRVGLIFGTVTLMNSIVDGDCESETETVITSNGYNIESPGDTCGFDQLTDQPNVSPDDLDLQPLADNGGPTQTHAITTDSAAFNAIPIATCEVDEDQRGVSRPQGPTCDVGAFELEQ